MKIIPDKLRFQDGKLVCVDGQDPNEYIGKWLEKKKNFSPDTPVNFILRDDLLRLMEAADILYFYGA